MLRGTNGGHVSRHLIGSLVGLVVAFGISACGGANDDGGPTATPVITTSVLEGGGPEERTSASINVGSASDLRTVLTELKPAMEQQCSTRISYVFGSSGQLKTQIEAGADFGLYLSADAQYPAELHAKGLVVANGLAQYGVGRVVLATRPGLPKLNSLDDLPRADIKRFTIGNPDHAPYGRAGRQAMEKAGKYAEMSGSLVLGENIRQVTDYVEKGDADAGITALALVINGSPASYTLIDSSLHLPIQQAGAVMKNTGAEVTARCLLQYLLDEPGQTALAKYGFEKAAP